MTSENRVKIVGVSAEGTGARQCQCCRLFACGVGAFCSSFIRHNRSGQGAIRTKCLEGGVTAQESRGPLPTVQSVLLNLPCGIDRLEMLLRAWEHHGRPAGTAAAKQMVAEKRVGAQRARPGRAC